MNCRGCKYFKNNKLFYNDLDDTYKKIETSSMDFGFCHRYPEVIEKNAKEFCGEHKDNGYS